MESSLRTLLVNYHIYKNGGSSVDKAIKNFVGENNFIELDKDAETLNKTGVDLERHYNAELLRNILEKRPNLRGFSCHRFNPNIHKMEEFSIFPIVFLRHPLLRLASIYRYEQISPDHVNTMSGIMATQTRFSTWLNYYLDTHNGCNYQTRYFSVRETDDEVRINQCDGDLKIAIEILDEIDNKYGIGIVENWNNTSNIIELKANNYSINIKLANIIENSTKIFTDYDLEIENLCETISKKTLIKFYEKNQNDMSIYKRYSNK